MRAHILVLATLVLAASPALADKLPKDATPLSSDEITKLYAGKTAVWSKSNAYFSPDGTIKLVFGKPRIEAALKGKWNVSGNEICMVNTSASGKVYTDCWKWWRSGKDLYTLLSRSYTGERPDEINGYYKSEIAGLKKGDLVSKAYAAAGGT
jgi:hypothetical protein